jgi:cytochrome c biogenesis protein CcdA
VITRFDIASIVGWPDSKFIRLIFILLFCFLFLPKNANSQTTNVQIDENGKGFTDYGQHSRNDTFFDTLSFSFLSTDYLILDYETTCDCIKATIQENGSIAISYWIDPAEATGRIEKILYLYTQNESQQILRIVLSAEVLPGMEQAESITTEETNPYSHSEIYESEPTLKVLLFSSRGCQECRRLKEKVLSPLMEKWQKKIQIVETDIDNIEGYSRLLATRNHYKITDKRSPYLLVVGKFAFTKSENISVMLEDAIRVSLENGDLTFLPSGIGLDQSEEVKSTFDSFLIWEILIAGLLDGLNPCAFATLVFFIGMLKYTGTSKRDIAIVGIGFTSTVFTVYLLLGLGVFKLFQQLSVYGPISKIIYLLTIILLLVLAFLSLKDLWLFYKTGDTKSASLQLSKNQKRRIHSVIRKGLKTKNLLFGAIGVGALVTLFEAGCTGQVYLPTIVLILMDAKEELFKAVLYLLFYNLMFILPLIAVFGFTYFGASSDRFVNWSTDNYALTRILLTAFFLIIAILMLFLGFV